MDAGEHADDEGPLDGRTLALLALGQLRHAVRNRPVTTLAGAFGAGYVLGRGLPDFVVRGLAAIALRAAADQVIARSIDARPPSHPAAGMRREPDAE